MLHILTFKQLTNQKQSMVARITARSPRKVRKSEGGGASSNVVGIICNPLFQIGLTYKPISGGPPVPTELLRHTFLPLSSAQRGEILSKVNLTGIYICFSDYVFSLPFELPNLKLGGNYSCQLVL